MHVPVVDPGHHHPAAEVDHLGAGPGERLGTGVRADVGDLAAGDRHRLLALAGERVDAAVEQHQLGCRSAATRRRPLRCPEHEAGRRGAAAHHEAPARQRHTGTR